MRETPGVALLVVAHSARLAEGVCEVAAQMAPDVALRAAGGRDDGGIGTSFDRVAGALAELLGAGHPVAVLTDLGSATMTAAAALEFADGEARLAHAPLVEGAIAAAVAAQIGRDLDEVVAAAEAAAAPAVPAVPPASSAQPPAGAVTRRATLVNDVGLHARPAAMLANLAARFDAEVTVDGADATSVTALILLDLPQGTEIEISATGPEAADAVEAIAALVVAGFA